LTYLFKSSVAINDRILMSSQHRLTYTYGMSYFSTLLIPCWSHEPHRTQQTITRKFFDSMLVLSSLTPSLTRFCTSDSSVTRKSSCKIFSYSYYILSSQQVSDQPNISNACTYFSPLYFSVHCVFRFVVLLFFLPFSLFGHN